MTSIKWSFIFYFEQYKTFKKTKSMRTMKTILSTLILSLVFISGNAQQSLSKKTDKAEDKTEYNYVVLTSNVEQLKPILMAAEYLMKEDEKHFGHFEIIICGKGAAELTDDKKMEEYLEGAGRVKANIMACGFSLKKFDIDPGKISDKIKIVDNGILYNMTLQKKGFLSLEL